jgi:transcriptional regulator with XRE-family HTH domain
VDQKPHSPVKGRQSFQFFLEGILAMTTDEVLDALGRYTRDSKKSDRQTATELGIRRSVLWDWLCGRIQPEKCALARLAGFLKRVGYL